jgi:hypothetical protein
MTKVMMMSSNILGRKVIKTALSYEGCSTGSKKHLEILERFNSVKPHGYTASKNDYWCAIFVSAMWIKIGLTSRETALSCNVDTCIADAKKLGIFYGKNHKPRTGDAIILDWDTNGRPNHIGLVVKVTDKYIYTIEGNAGDKGVCKRKVYSRGTAIIYGYICPRYNAILLNRNAIKFSYPAGTSVKVYKKRPNKAYREAWRKYFPKIKMIVACHIGIMLLLKADGYARMPLSWKRIPKFMSKRFVRIKCHHRDSDWKAGDIGMYKRIDENGDEHFHMWAMVEIDGKLYMAEASQPKHYAMHLRGTKKANKAYAETWIWRAKER